VFWNRSALASACGLLFFLVCFTGHPGTGKASDGSVRVRVEAEGADGEQARTRALAQGERKAFRRFLEQQEPALPARGEPSDEQVHEWMVGFEIHREKLSARRYKALVSYWFDQDAIATWFQANRKASAPAASAQAAPKSLPSATLVRQKDAAPSPARPGPENAPSPEATPPSSLAVLRIRVSFEKLPQWVRFWQAMQKLSSVHTVTVHAFGPREGILECTMVSSSAQEEFEDILKKELACMENGDNGSVSSPEEGVWHVRFTP
jgi:hypothetical protein